MNQKYRLVTRSDFDGLVCAALFKELDMIADIKFVHPKDMQDGKIEVSNRDITANIPYSPGVHLAFDHHISETIRISQTTDNLVIDPDSPSAARVVYNYYGGAPKFPRISQALMDAVDKADTAQFTVDEIIYPTGWALLNFIMDPRTGLGRFRDFRISNYQLMMALITACIHLSVEEILELPDVKERVELYKEHEEKAIEQIRRCSMVFDNVVVIDMRDEEQIYPNNRFTVYALYPECNVSLHVMWGLKQQNTVFAIGKSILNRSCRINIGELALSYGGGGHIAAGTCQVDNDQAESVLKELIGIINAEG